MTKPIFVQFTTDRDALFEHPVVRVQYGGFTAYLSCHDNPCEEGMNSMGMCILTIHIRKPGRLPSFDGHAQFITTGPCIPFFI